MESHIFKIVETAIVIFILIIANLITKRFIKNILKKFKFSLQRRKLTLKIINLFLFIMAVIFISAIWGVKESDMVVFISSAMAVIGIAFFAQWSFLSNITAGLILFFNHPLKLGDHIRFLEKDNMVDGKITDITFFFVHIRMEKGEIITVPNSVILQKTISVHSRNQETEGDRNIH
ncbi:MAG: mechanosensitive ion channel family protein [Prolixibacteraceae bacterium]|nr:mechanosensitive ion channel family protein [Prolixibacteraceae bacterium]MBN2774578.1 mechanosensitive ion channel family protein [Prolixibacteraceae bacterium]